MPLHKEYAVVHRQSDGSSELFIQFSSYLFENSTMLVNTVCFMALAALGMAAPLVKDGEDKRDFCTSFTAISSLDSEAKLI